jgi:hypothetical protein
MMLNTMKFEEMIHYYDMKLVHTGGGVQTYSGGCEDDLSILKVYVPDSYELHRAYGKDFGVFYDIDQRQIVSLIDKTLEFIVCADSRTFHQTLCDKMDEVEQMEQGTQAWQEWWVERLKKQAVIAP